MGGRSFGRRLAYDITSMIFTLVSRRYWNIIEYLVQPIRWWVTKFFFFHKLHSNLSPDWLLENLRYFIRFVYPDCKLLSVWPTFLSVSTIFSIQFRCSVANKCSTQFKTRFTFGQPLANALSSLFNLFPQFSSNTLNLYN